MKISRLGNDHSKLLDSIMDVQPTKNEQSSFQKIANSILSQPGKPTLRQVFAQFEEMGDSVVDAEPMGDPAAPVGDPAMGEEPGAPAETVTEEIKQKLVDALIAACGGVEEAKQCLDSVGGVGDELGSELGGEMGGEMEPSMPDDSIGGDLGAPVADEMAAPMEMPAPMSY